MATHRETTQPVPCFSFCLAPRLAISGPPSPAGLRQNRSARGDLVSDMVSPWRPGQPMATRRVAPQSLPRCLTECVARSFCCRLSCRHLSFHCLQATWLCWVCACHGRKGRASPLVGTSQGLYGEVLRSIASRSPNPSVSGRVAFMVCISCPRSNFLYNITVNTVRIT